MWDLHESGMEPLSPAFTGGFLTTGPPVLCLVAQLCPTLCDPMDCSVPGSSVHGDSPGKNTGVGCHALLQGIFPTQGLNPGLLHSRWILYHLGHQGSPQFRSFLMLVKEILKCTLCPLPASWYLLGFIFFLYPLSPSLLLP